jgi:hypothetical protein
MKLCIVSGLLGKILWIFLVALDAVHEAEFDAVHVVAGEIGLHSEFFVWHY